MVEVAPHHLGHVDDAVVASRQRRSTELTRLLNSSDYVAFRILSGGRLETQVDGSVLGTTSTLDCMDYICLPNEQLGTLSALVV